VERVLTNLVEQKRSAPQQEREGSGITVSCMYRWYHELDSHINMLATEGAKRLGIAPLSGILQTVWRSLKAHVGAEGFLMRLQEALVRDHPPLGIFRTLIPLDNS